MNVGLELKKLKRTGYISAFIAGGLLAAAFPAVNMAVRSENYISMAENPLTILMSANWQLMAMLNILLVVCGACIMYHTEYADNGVQKMDMLPVRAGTLFFGKSMTAILFSGIMILIETASLALCAAYWFADYELNPAELVKTAGFAMVLLLPTIFLMLVIASCCRNMWLSLGIGVILVFVFSILPQDNVVLRLCPFNSPYQVLQSVQAHKETGQFLAVCGVETIVFGIAELIFLKLRRYFA